MKKYIIWGAALLSAFTASASNDLVTDLGNGSLNIDLSQNQLGTNIENGITGYTLPATDTSAKTSLDSKLTMLKLTLTLPDDATGSTVSKLIVSGLHNKATYLTGSNAYSTFSDDNLGDITVTNGSNGFAIGSDRKVTACVAIFPEDVAANQLKITATVGDDKYYRTLSAAKSLKEGKLIPVTVNLKSTVLHWENGITSADDVKDAINDNNLIIASDEDLTIADFEVLRSVLGSEGGYADGTINLTLLNQTSLPVNGSTGALEFCKSLKSVSAPNVTLINNYALDNCTNLTTVSLPKATSVGMGAFYSCKGLTTVSLPEGTSVGKQAFSSCEKLATVSLPKATSVGEEAFFYCPELTTVSLPEATSVGEEAFSYCDKLTTVSLPKATSVDAGAFNDCDRSNIALTVKAGTDWWQKIDDGDNASNNYGWKEVNIYVTNLKSEYTKEDYKTWSTDNCGSAPTLDQMKMYLGAGVYWDNGDPGDNQQTYTIKDETYHTGLWVKKKAYISGFSEGTANKPAEDLVNPTQGRPEDINQYFFLPAAGRCSFDIKYAGSYGWYWSSSPSSDTCAYCLSIGENNVGVTSVSRGYYGYLPMVAE